MGIRILRVLTRLENSLKDKRIKKVVLRHMGQKYPKINFTIDDESTSSMTMRSDVVTALILLLCAKREIALGIFGLEGFVYGPSDDGLSLSELRDCFLENRQTLVYIGHLCKATYEHDQLSLNTMRTRLGTNAKI